MSLVPSRSSRRTPPRSRWIVYALACVACACASAPRPAPTLDEAFRRSAPPVPPSPRLVLPAFQRADLDNGLELMVGERHRPPLVHISLVFAAGSGSDPVMGAGLARLTYNWLLEGAGAYDATELNAAFAALGTTPSLQVDPDGASIGVTVLSEHAADALALLAQVVRNPKLDEPGFQRCQAQQIADIHALSSDPDFLARQEFARAAYGSAHPYGHTSVGTPESVAAIDSPAAHAFYADAIGPAAMAVVMTGDITLAEATALTQRDFGDWRAPARRPATPPAVEAASGSPLRRVDRPGLTQTVLLVGRPALPAGDPDEAALEIATAAIGGMFSSRLNLDLRERHGYAYGAHAVFDARRGMGPWLADAAVRTNVTADALAAMLTDLKRLALTPFTVQEVEDARRSLIDAMPGEFESAGDLAEVLTQTFWLDQPLDRYQRLISGLIAATPAHVEELGVRFFHPSQLTIVTVGEGRVLSSQLAKISFDPPRTISMVQADR